MNRRLECEWGTEVYSQADPFSPTGIRWVLRMSIEHKGEFLTRHAAWSPYKDKLIERIPNLFRMFVEAGEKVIAERFSLDMADTSWLDSGADRR